MTYETILVETDARGTKGVTLITINRPQALNALNSQVLAELIAAFAAYLMVAELQILRRPKTYAHILCEMGLSLHIVFFYLLEVGSSDIPLDFRANFLPTWLGVTIVGSMSVSIGKTLSASMIKERR